MSKLYTVTSIVSVQRESLRCSTDVDTTTATLLQLLHAFIRFHTGSLEITNTASNRSIRRRRRYLTMLLPPTWPYTGLGANTGRNVGTQR